MEDFLKGFLSENFGLFGPSEKWIKWEHLTLGVSHCEECLSLHGCWFQNRNKPPMPHHVHCHCIAMPISFGDVLDSAKTNSAYSKFNPYLFDPDKRYNHGKDKLFESWGYSITDAEWIQTEINRQALEKYISGDYILGRLNRDGQRISIRIELDRKDGLGEVSFLSGWMVQPNGEIRMTTPYGGK